MTDASLAGASRAGSRPGGSGATESGLAATSPAEPSARAATLAWLAHPVSLAGIALLLFNDHLLKTAFGTWWTGKLSDVAGLVFAPALVAVVASLIAPRARPAALARGAILGVGLTFALVKATTVGATAASAAWTAVTGPALGTASVVRHDPTDLLALPALALAWWAFAQARKAHEPGRRTRTLRAAIVIPVAVFAVAATSASEPPKVDTVTSVDGVAYVAFDADYLAEAWAMSSDGVHFVWASPEEVSAAGLGVDRFPEPTPQACVPDAPDTCFRITPNAIGVEASATGGAKWRPEWSLTAAQLAQIASDTWNYDRPAVAAEFASSGVAIVGSGASFQVYVANGRDGFAVRDADGTWRRAIAGGGRVTEAEAASLGQIEPPPFPVAWSGRFAVPIPWAGAAGFVALVALAVAFGRGFRPRKLWAATALLLVGGVILFAVGAGAAEVPRGSWDPAAMQWNVSGAWVGQAIGSALAAWALTGAVVKLTMLDRRDRALAIVGAIAVGLGSMIMGLVEYSLSHSLPRTAIAMAVVTIVALAVELIAFRWWRRRHPAVPMDWPPPAYVASG